MTNLAVADEFRAAMVKLDVAAVRGLAAKLWPHLPPPKTDADALASLHMARTGTDTIPQRHRYYSHQWCTERGYPSNLPDELKPAAERMYPRVVDAVGVAVKSTNPAYAPISLAVRGAMSNAVEECYADGHSKDIPLIRARMLEARRRELRGFGL